VPCIIEGFGFPGKAVVLFSVAEWRWIRELNKINTSNDSSLCETLSLYKNSIRTSQETYYVSAASTNRLTLFTVRTYESHNYNLWEECRFSYVIAGGIYGEKWALR
jgi:hypothetical protein